MSTDVYRLDTCDVHELVDGDSSKRMVAYCRICDAWMCDTCKDNELKRVAAWGIRANRKLSQTLKDVSKRMRNKV